MYCMHSIPLHNCGEIYNHHLYLLGHTQKQLPVSTAEPFSWVPLEMQQAYAEKRYFFSSFSGCMPPHLQASPPISRFQLPISSTEMIKSKQKKKSLFSPPFFFFSWFGRKWTKDRKSMLAICQKVRAQRRGGGGEWKDGALSIYHSSKLFSCSNHINCRQLFNKQTIFLGIFSEEMKPPLPLPLPLKGKAPLMQIRLPYLPLTSTELRQSLFMCVVGWIGVVSRPTKPDAGQLACLSICSRPWFNESVCVVDKACRVKASTWCVGFPSAPPPPSQEKKQIFSLRSESHLLSFSHSLSIFLLFKWSKTMIFSDRTLKKKKEKRKTNGERCVWTSSSYSSLDGQCFFRK